MATAPFRWSTSDDGRPRLPGSLHVNRRLSQWVRFGRDRTVAISPGKVEIGQGIVTALAQIAAEELDVALGRIRMVSASTARSPDEGVTSGSLSTQESGAAIRHACAEVRRILLEAAAAEFNVDPATLDVNDGEITSADGRVRTHYWAIADDDLLDREATPGVTPKPPEAHQIVGRSVARLDLPDKVFGRPRYLHDITRPGLLHARVVRSSAPVATLDALDDAPVRAMPGVTAVVRDGSFLAVIATDEAIAVKAADALAGRVRWREPAALPDAARLADFLTTAKSERKVVHEKTPETPVVAARRFEARYLKPYLAHASIGPSCAIAEWRDDGTLEVWTHSQGIGNLRADLAITLGRAPESIVVHHAEGAGCYGHNGADDVALDAVLAARAVPGRPVRLLWSREAELTSAPFGSAHLNALEAALDAEGRIVQWRHTIWANGYSGRPGRADTPTLLAASELAKPFERIVSIDPPLASGGGADRNAVPLYDFPGVQVVKHRLLEMPLRTSAMRALGATANVFAIESFMDELAHAANADPIAFRRAHLADPRAHAVIDAALAAAPWWTEAKGEGIGHGFGVARYKNSGAWCAVAARIEARESIRVLRLAIGVDVGQVINPDGVVNQIEGGAIQAVSWALIEAVAFDRTRILSRAWEDYPILGFSDVPEVDVTIVSRPEAPPLGAGEAAQGPTVAAIANAIFDALGVRVREMPFTFERVAAAG